MLNLIRLFSSSNSKPDITSVHIFTNLKDSDILLKTNKDLKNVSGIYAFQFIETNEIVYIGSTIDLARRFWQHYSNNGSNIILQRAFNKYGIEAFNFLVLELYSFDLSKSDKDNMLILTQIEQKYMDLYDSKYNILRIAKSSKGYKHSDEAKVKMSAIHSGKITSDETKQLISNRLKGRILSEETRKRISNSRRGIPRTEETKASISTARSIPVYLYEYSNESLVLVENFDSVTNVGKALKANKSTIMSYAKSGAIFRKIYRLSLIPIT